jgi:hypothetical protein
MDRLPFTGGPFPSTFQWFAIVLAVEIGAQPPDPTRLALVALGEKDIPPGCAKASGYRAAPGRRTDESPTAPGPVRVIVRRQVVIKQPNADAAGTSASGPLAKPRRSPVMRSSSSKHFARRMLPARPSSAYSLSKGAIRRTGRVAKRTSGATEHTRRDARPGPAVAV